MHIFKIGLSIWPKESLVFIKKFKISLKMEDNKSYILFLIQYEQRNFLVKANSNKKQLRENWLD